MMFTLEVLLVVAVLVAVGYPIFRRSSESKLTLMEGDDYHNLLYAKDAAYMAIKDLDFDYRTGKLDEEDYRQLKRQYEGEAVAILRKLDHMQKDGLTRPAGLTRPE